MQTTRVAADVGSFALVANHMALNHPQISLRYNLIEKVGAIQTVFGGARSFPTQPTHRFRLQAGFSL
jgi:hypothetical protein